MPRSERYWRVLEWYEVREAEAEAAKDAQRAEIDAIARRELDKGLSRGLGG